MSDMKDLQELDLTQLWEGVGHSMQDVASMPGVKPDVAIDQLD